MFETTWGLLVISIIVLFNNHYPQENNKANSEVRKGREGGEGKDGVAYTTLLRNELLGTSIEDLRDTPDERRALSPVQSPNLYHVSLNWDTDW